MHVTLSPPPPSGSSCPLHPCAFQRIALHCGYMSTSLVKHTDTNLAEHFANAANDAILVLFEGVCHAHAAVVVCVRRTRSRRRMARMERMERRSSTTRRGRERAKKDSGEQQEQVQEQEHPSSVSARALAQIHCATYAAAGPPLVCLAREHLSNSSAPCPSPCLALALPPFLALTLPPRLRSRS